MNPVTKAFADALVQNAGIIVGVAITALVAIVEAARRWVVAKLAQSAVDQHDDEALAAEQVRSLPRALRPIRGGNVEKVVARAMLRRKQRLSEAPGQLTGSLAQMLPADDDKTPTDPPGDAA